MSDAKMLTAEEIDAAMAGIEDVEGIEDDDLAAIAAQAKRVPALEAEVARLRDKLRSWEESV